MLKARPTRIGSSSPRPECNLERLLHACEAVRVASGERTLFNLPRAHGREGSDIFFPHAPTTGDGGGIGVPWSRHGCRPRDGEHARVRAWTRSRPERAVSRCD